MRTTRHLSHRPAILATVATVALALLTVLLLRPDPGREYMADLRELYPGVTVDGAANVAKAQQVCDAGAPDSWWYGAWDNGTQVRVDLWNLSIEHFCPDLAAQMRPAVTP